jgi:hypothetical protein
MELDPYRKTARQPIILCSMDAFIDSVILATAVLFSFGAAFVAQSATLRLILKAMNRR